MPKGKHPDEALDDETIRRLEKPGRYADGNCLYLVVDPSGAKHWVLRIMVLGRRRDMGLGSLKMVTLARARQRAKKYRLEARNGGDPLANRRAHKGTDKIAKLIEVSKKAKDPDFKRIWEHKIRQLVRKAKEIR